MQSKGIERKTHMEAYGKENREGKLDLTNGKFENMIETASKVAGLTRKQYKEWREMENWKRRRRMEGGKPVEEKGKKKWDTRPGEKRGDPEEN